MEWALFIGEIRNAFANAKHTSLHFANCGVGSSLFSFFVDKHHRVRVHQTKHKKANVKKNESIYFSQFFSWLEPPTPKLYHFSTSRCQLVIFLLIVHYNSIIESIQSSRIQFLLDGDATIQNEIISEILWNFIQIVLDYEHINLLLFNKFQVIKYLGEKIEN